MELVEGHNPFAPGRALDLGCGTGNEVAYLARRGWTATGVELVQVAVDRAASRIEGLPHAAVLRGDVTRLVKMRLIPFDLVLDLGCFHSLPSDGRDAYAAGVGSFTVTGAVLFMFAFAERLPPSFRTLRRGRSGRRAISRAHTWASLPASSGGRRRKVRDLQG